MLHDTAELRYTAPRYTAGMMKSTMKATFYWTETTTKYILSYFHAVLPHSLLLSYLVDCAVTFFAVSAHENGLSQLSTISRLKLSTSVTHVTQSIKYVTCVMNCMHLSRCVIIHKQGFENYVNVASSCNAGLLQSHQQITSHNDGC
jgi:hypothetical protein